MEHRFLEMQSPADTNFTGGKDVPFLNVKMQSGITGNEGAPDSVVDGDIVGLDPVIDAKFRVLSIERQDCDGLLYNAEQKIGKRRVVLKVLGPDYDIVSRKIIGIKHPNINRQHALLSLANGSSCIVTEPPTGLSLVDLLSTEQSMGLERAVAIMSQVLSAVGVIHRKSLVLGNLTPRNIYVSEDPKKLRVKLVGVGVVKKQGFGDDLSYKSPEQVSGKTGNDARSDIWSAGAILFELVFGKRPFSGETSEQLSGSILLNEPLFPEDLSPELARVAVVIARALQKDPQDRYQSVSHLLGDLRPLQAAIRRSSIRLPRSPIEVDLRTVSKKGAKEAQEVSTAENGDSFLGQKISSEIPGKSSSVPAEESHSRPEKKASLWSDVLKQPSNPRPTESRGELVSEGSSASESSVLVVVPNSEQRIADPTLAYSDRTGENMGDVSAIVPKKCEPKEAFRSEAQALFSGQPISMTDTEKESHVGEFSSVVVESDEEFREDATMDVDIQDIEEVVPVRAPKEEAVRAAVPFIGGEKPSESEPPESEFEISEGELGGRGEGDHEIGETVQGTVESKKDISEIPVPEYEEAAAQFVAQETFSPPVLPKQEPLEEFAGSDGMTGANAPRAGVRGRKTSFIIIGIAILLAVIAGVGFFFGSDMDGGENIGEKSERAGIAPFSENAEDSVRKDEPMRGDETVRKDEPMPGDETVRKDEPMPGDETVRKDEPMPADETVRKDEPMPADETVRKDEPMPADETVRKDEPMPPEEPTSVVLTLEGVPDKAMIWVNEEKSSNPITVLQSREPITIAVHAEGYKSFREIVIPSENKKIGVSMKKIGKSKVRTPRKRRPKISAKKAKKGPGTRKPKAPKKKKSQGKLASNPFGD